MLFKTLPKFTILYFQTIKILKTNYVEAYELNEMIEDEPNNERVTTTYTRTVRYRECSATWCNNQAVQETSVNELQENTKNASHYNSLPH